LKYMHQIWYVGKIVFQRPQDGQTVFLVKSKIADSGNIENHLNYKNSALDKPSLPTILCTQLNPFVVHFCNHELFCSLKVVVLS